MDDNFTLKPYKFGYFISATYVLIGILWLVALFLDMSMGLIGHGFSNDALMTASASVGFIAVGIGVSWRWKAALILAPIICLGLPYLYVMGIGEFGALSLGEYSFLAVILALNAYYFLYNYKIIKDL